ncbi:MAG: hypothetical protein ACRDN0_36360 [Trebonia sp.]
MQLPVHLDWSGNAACDLDAPGRTIDLYRAVLIEAATSQDLYAYLDAGMLRRLWAPMWLPVQLRRSWEQKFPVLAEISRMTATAYGRAMEPRHERIAKIALAAGARYGLALAGGYAVAAHGIGNRPSGDGDLVSSWQHRDEFPALIAAVVSALEPAGYKASVVISAETFVRLTATDPVGGSEEKIELSADWRAHDRSSWRLAAESRWLGCRWGRLRRAGRR